MVFSFSAKAEKEKRLISFLSFIATSQRRLE